MSKPKFTERVARLNMSLKTPNIESEVCVAISAQQWHLINAITDSVHPSHVHNAKQTEYTLLHTEKLESDQTEMAVYIDEHHQVWVRPMAEFKEKFTAKPAQIVLSSDQFDDAWAD